MPIPLIAIVVAYSRILFGLCLKKLKSINNFRKRRKSFHIVVVLKLTTFKMQGLSIESLKKHKALIPLYVCTGIGCAGAVFYLLRLATRNPDVSWSKKNNPEPWEEYRTKQYKFYSPNRDYSKEECPAPKY